MLGGTLALCKPLIHTEEANHHCDAEYLGLKIAAVEEEFTIHWTELYLKFMYVF